MIKRTLEDHLFGPGPKRILALDGGGVRGVVTLAYLAKIEKILRERHGNDDAFRLCDYFDLIGGTSTGSIIAAGLAMGKSVEQLQKLYGDLADSIFTWRFWRQGLFIPKFPVKPLEKALRREFGDITLGSPELKTGLMVMSKRLDTSSPWVIHNNPRGKYFNPRPNSKAVPNRQYLVRQVVRASTAAPSFFKPERIPIAQDMEGAFVDGGVSPHNNPSLQLLLMATLEGFHLQWPLGEKQLLLVSVGTGSKDKNYAAGFMFRFAGTQALKSLLSLMEDCDALAQTMLQWMSSSPTAENIDSEIGDLSNDRLGGHKWMSYLRYNLKFEQKWLQAILEEETPIAESVLDSLEKMDRAENVVALETLSRRAAEKQVNDIHFPNEFDLPAEAAATA